ncbi:hypothetical protein DRO64_03900 [Candidatus Bathyarchaeota archaeon]|nr:MAG: hypothetical protein DRO64_03900 [Candidatus Bathyarchaeota archaeon]
MRKLNYQVVKFSNLFTRLVKENKTELLLLSLMILVTAHTTFVQLVYHHNYQTFAWDLGIFLQSLETFVFHGKLFYNTVELPYNPSGSYFGIHFSPILFLIAVPYAVYPHPLTLFLIKNLLICAASPIIYKIAKEQQLSELTSALIAVTYLFFLPMYGPLTWDFHPYYLLPLFISLTHLYILKKHYRATLIVTILGLSTNEFAAILYIFYGLCLFLKGLKEIAKKIILLSTAWFIFAIMIISLLNPRQLQYYISSLLTQGLLKEKLTQFGFDIFTMINRDKLAYLVIVYGFLLFLPLLSPIEGILTILPWISIMLISKHAPYYSPYYQYPAFISVQLFLATINSVRKIMRIRLQGIVALTLVALNISSAIILGPIGFGFLDYATKFTRPTHFHTINRFNLIGIDVPNRDALEEALSIIPENASLLVQNHLFPHVCQRSNSYASLIPEVTGWPIIYKDLNLRKVEWISIFSSPDRRRRFLGERKATLIILNDRKMLLNQDAIILRLKKAVDVKRLFFECQLKPNDTSVSQVILSSNAFELGLGSNGYLILLIYSKERDTIIRFSDMPLNPGKWYEVTLSITPNEAFARVNGRTTIRFRFKNRVIAWIVDNVDYVILDSTASIPGFRIGSIPIILSSKYKLIAAGNGVMVFSAHKTGRGMQNLTSSKYLMTIYPSDEPVGKPIMVMPLSKLLWKPITSPLAPQCLIVELEDELYNVTITGAEEYAFTRPVMKAYLAKRIRVRCSAIIHGKIKVNEAGYYVVKIKKTIPSILEVRIDGMRITEEKPVYLSSGSHFIEVVWKKVRYPLLEIKLIRLSHFEK